ncbi:hypothetical protein E4U54_003094 [Claviceps lovelessii]|nr:hypothetical protein E4U54_003094 [Claviceps lovelessii]
MARNKPSSSRFGCQIWGREGRVGVWAEKAEPNARGDTQTAWLLPALMTSAEAQDGLGFDGLGRTRPGSGVLMLHSLMLGFDTGMVDAGIVNAGFVDFSLMVSDVGRTWLLEAATTSAYRLPSGVPKAVQ